MRKAPVSVGERFDLEVEKLVAGGDALCRLDGFPIFVPGIYPGDVAGIEILEVKRGFARGKLVALVTPSDARRASSCPAATECGGCDWTELRLDRQLDAKLGILTDSLHRTGRLTPEQLPEIRVHSSPLNYRIRSRFHVDPTTGSIGFFAPRSHRVVPLPDDCEVVGTRTLSGMSRLGGARRAGDTIEVFESESGLVTVWRDEDESAGEDVDVRVGSTRFRLSTESFFQVNRHLLKRLLDLIASIGGGLDRNGLAFDLYGGVGFFALPLAEFFAEVVTVEGGESSSEYAMRNVEARSSVTVVRKSVEAFLAEVRTQPDFVLVDPPRAGLSSKVRRELRRIQSPVIAYLSCDPVTFSRDVAELVGCGWEIRTLDLIDLFPNTHHVETLASLVIAD